MCFLFLKNVTVGQSSFSQLTHELALSATPKAEFSEAFRCDASLHTLVTAPKAPWTCSSHCNRQASFLAPSFSITWKVFPEAIPGSECSVLGSYPAEGSLLTPQYALAGNLEPDPGIELGHF